MNLSFSKKIRVAFWVLAIALGAAQAWISRFDLVNDTISYLDMGDYFFHGHPGALINGIWSPLYAFLLGATLAIFKPSLYMEYPTIHLLLFFIFLLTVACFDFFLGQLAFLRAGFSPEKSSSQLDWPWAVIVYVIFLWSTLGLIGVYETNPDMMIAGFFYLSCGLLIKISTERATWKTFLGLGVALGLSYLTKGVMFPLSLILLATAWLVARQKSRYIFVSVAAFVVVAAPYITILSIQRRHITVGESGKYNYAVHVNGIARHHWQGETQIDGLPIHPTREIFASPATFEFNGPLPGTYPVWYDPTFWYEGVVPHLRLREEFKAALKNLYFEFATVFYGLDGILFISLLLAFLEAEDRLRAFENLFRCWFLVVPTALGLGLYALVHYETRYVSPFFVVLGVCLFSCVLWADDFPKRRFFSSIAILLLVFFLWLSALPTLNSLRHPWISPKGSYQAVAEGAIKSGLRPGDQVASLNFSNLGMAMWARLARLEIVAEVYYWPGGPEGTSSFWNTDAATQDRLLQRLSQTGAKAVVSSDPPSGPGASRWSRIGNTGYYLLWLNSRTLTSEKTAPEENYLK